MRVEQIGNATLYLGRCEDILPTLPKVDAVLTDPPYGIGEDGGFKNRKPRGNFSTKHAALGWDSERPPAEVFDLIQAAAPVWFICGGNYFADLLPPSMGWLYWDKKIGGDFSDGELIYTNRRAALRALSVHAFEGLQGGLQREHPTQKPVRLMVWCLGFVPDAVSVLDPFMGSGTTGVACANLGRQFIGIEREPTYFEIAVRRIEEAYKQPRLFAEPEPKPVQPSLLDGAA